MNKYHPLQPLPLLSFLLSESESTDLTVGHTTKDSWLEDKHPSEVTKSKPPGSSPGPKSHTEIPLAYDWSNCAKSYALKLVLGPGVGSWLDSGNLTSFTSPKNTS